MKTKEFANIDLERLSYIKSNYKKELHDYIKALDYVYRHRHRFSKDVFEAIYTFLSGQIADISFKIRTNRKGVIN